ncbi:uncharacterized protein isoform X2 [Choristoneura fumiferana]|uniref:uncharacterized protein isoform X2 n=1 Tax=Choristoneura fumiferana TaxID=7141 RepID=UPI003D15A68B
MNCLSTVVAFCVLHNFALGSDEDYTNVNPLINDKQRQYEVNAGSKTDLMENKHYYYPSHYSDLSRRFVPVYPYEEKTKSLDEDDALASLKELIQASQLQTESVDKEAAKLIPVRAPPELVIAIAKQSAKVKRPTPSIPTEKVLRNNILRSGDYWNAIWTENVDPSNQLRTNEKPVSVSMGDVCSFAPYTIKNYIRLLIGKM